jgi:hypothetical protein
MPTPPPTDYREIRRIAITAIFSDDVLFEHAVLKGGNALSIALGLSNPPSRNFARFSLSASAVRSHQAGKRWKSDP